MHPYRRIVQVYDDFHTRVSLVNFPKKMLLRMNIDALAEIWEQICHFHLLKRQNHERMVK